MKSKPVKGYEDIYTIYEDGRIVSTKRRVPAPNARTRIIPAQVMKPHTRDDGRQVYRLSKEGRVREHSLKTLLLNHFPTEKDMLSADVLGWMSQVMEDVSRLRVTIDSYQGSQNVDQKVRQGMLDDLRKLSGRIKKLGYDETTSHP